MVFCSSKQLDPTELTDSTVIGIYNRLSELEYFHKDMDDLYETMKAFPTVNYWYLVMPKSKLPSGKIPLDFDPKKTEEMIKWGI